MAKSPAPRPGLSGRVLITGGSGFLGRAILRRAARENWPARFTIYSRDETKQWELKHRYPNANCLLGDVARDLPRLIAAMAGHDTVIHAAAVKYIPEAEKNVFETVEVNVTGSLNVALAAHAAGVAMVVGISTDKACAPLNLYGATKMVMERAFAEANRLGPTRYVTVRYGNVVGSTGSVIPLFRRQLGESGRISVTDPRMTRFWLGVDQAIDLILWAAEGAGVFPGHTFIDACPAMSIVELAGAVYARWCADQGREVDARMPIDFVGIRPGEKLTEQLFNEQEAPRIMRAGLSSESEGFILAPATALVSSPMQITPDQITRARAGLSDYSQPIMISTVDEGYSSGSPSRWLSVEEMIELMRDAEGV